MRRLERLLRDEQFRSELLRDPEAAARRAGLDESDLGDPMETLDPRESRSSLAGLFLAAVVEGVGDHGDGHVALPSPDDALVSGARTPSAGGGWVFIRDGESFPGNHPNYAHLHDDGASGVLWNPDDAKADQGITSSREAQFGGGIWLVPHPNETPDEFARRTVDAIVRYRPDKVVLDIEAIGKGYAGSTGWRWSDEMMKTFSRLQPEPPPLAVTVEPLQDDFNYAAYTSRGAEVWPQAYLGDMTPRDPEEVVERVVANGVPRELVVPVLGPGQLDGYDGPHNLYTADDAQGSPSA